MLYGIYRWNRSMTLGHFKKFPIPSAVWDNLPNGIRFAESVESLLATAGVHAHPGHVGGGGRVEPVELARDPHPGLIKMGHMGFPDGIRNTRDGRGQIAGCGVNHPDHGTRRQGYTTSIAQDPGGAQNRQHVVLGEIDDGGLYPRTILRGGCNPFWKVAPMYLAAGAACFQNAMFGDFNLLRRNVEYLAGFRYVGLVQSAATGIAGCWQGMDDHLIRFGDALQR